MTKRLSHRELCKRLLDHGSTLLCYRCHEPMLYAEDIEREHLHEKALGGDDSADNAAFSHVGCHAQITRGSGATTAGSSIHRAAKANSATRKDKFIVDKKTVDQPREQRTRFGNTTFGRRT